MSRTHENIYQMLTRHGVTRISWSHPKAAAQVVSVGGLSSGVLPGTPPYHSDGSKRVKLKVMAMISYQSEPAKLGELSSPGTYAYTKIDRPAWCAVP